MITSIQNQQIKNLLQLIKKAKYRNEKKFFVIEGIKLFQEVPKNLVEMIYVAESFFNKNEYQKILENFTYEVVKDEVFQKVSDTQTPQGIMCIIRQQEYTLKGLLNCENPHLILLEDLQDPGNVGTMIRTGEGAGVTGVILSKNSVDIYNPKTIRSTMGSLFRMPFLYVEDFFETVLEVKKLGIKTYAATLDGEQFYDEVNYSSSIGFLIGNEGNGLSPETLSLADFSIKIPMEGKVESLNAAVAATVLMYEAYRQRR